MSFIDDAKALATMPLPGPGAPHDQRKAYDAMAMPELAGLWCSLQYVGLRDMTDEAWGGVLYFDRLPHEAPERAFELVLTVLRSEAHKSVKMELNNKLMTALVNVHGPRLIDQIEAAAHEHARLRWLLGGACWWASDAAVKARLAALADEDAWRADEAARDTPAQEIDFTALSVPELARFWLEQKCKPHKDQDANYLALDDYERELRESDPDKVLDLVLEILRIEADPRVLSFLAAGPLEDIISMRTIDRIEREAAASDAFRTLLQSAWYYRQPDELEARLDAITQPGVADSPKG